MEHNSVNHTFSSFHWNIGPEGRRLYKNVKNVFEFQFTSIEIKRDKKKIILC